MNEDPVLLRMETMLKFCGDPKPAMRVPIDKPYLNRGRIVATDARILIAISPDRADFDVASLHSDGHDLNPHLFPFDHDSVPEKSWLDVPEVEVPTKQCPACLGSGKTHVCKRCDGEGGIRYKCSECGHEHMRDCPDCGGNGRYPGGEEKTCHRCNGEGLIVDREDIAFPIGPIKLNKVYLDKIRRNLSVPKIEILKSSDDSKPVRFKFDGGLGYLMHIRRDFP